MNNNIRIVLAQLNQLVGDVSGNTNKMIDAAKTAKEKFNAHLIVFPELSITGYPPEDLLLRPDLHARVERAIAELCHQVNDIDLLIGYPQKVENGIYNAAAYIRDGKILARYFKQKLPNYGVFDEKRYFIPGQSSCIVDLNGLPLGIVICEDVWQDGPTKQAKLAGAQVIITINASPFDLYKSKLRENVVKSRAIESEVPIIYCACVGGQDEVVFDGGSFAVDEKGDLKVHAGYYEETLMLVEVTPEGQLLQGHITPPLSEEANIYEALKLGVKDYVKKNHFHGAVLGLSGGIDSALVLCIAADALGAENVKAVMLPSRYTSSISLEDANLLVNNLKVESRSISIEPSFEAFLTSLKDEFKDYPQDDITEQNIQARCRGVILMAISNKEGFLVLTTGNKSEMAVGYATLYGDMAGGFALIKDVPKTMVYRLANYRNKISPVIPQRILDRPPTAELAHDQKDEDSLPPYPILDDILQRYVEEDQSIADIVSFGYEEELVRHIINSVEKNEYKRRQAPPGVRITKRAFGRERRYPITSGFGKDH